MLSKLFTRKLKGGIEKQGSDAVGWPLLPAIAERSEPANLQHVNGSAMRGDADAAFMWLERAHAQRNGGTVYIKVLPFQHLVKDDARYLPFLKKMGLDG